MADRNRRVYPPIVGNNALQLTPKLVQPEHKPERHWAATLRFTVLELMGY
ncbi:hypothetical protein ACFS5J_13010 [Flavobacterium chuncheonense]|uniref:Uncharacterized protein n=1 Tax=Flavobacterium chuncheonense TaxID=2026653 RepID=A0ABW5YPF2_9FLAO